MTIRLLLLTASLAAASPAPAAPLVSPAAARQQQTLPPGVTRMSARDRMTQCHEMMIPILDQIEKREKQRASAASVYTRDDRQADEMAMAGLQDCRDLLGDLTARLQRVAPALPRRR